MITLICEQCQQPYQSKPYMERISKRHFCGMACYAKWQSEHNAGRGRKRVSTTCDWCGETIEKQPNAVSEHNFCNRKCLGKWRSANYSGKNNAAWLGGNIMYRGPNWNTQSRAARKRDQDTCQHCGYSAPNLNVHHIKPFRLFTDYREANSLDNLITLCPFCHGKAEQKFLTENPDLACILPPPVVPVQACRSCGKDFVPDAPGMVACHDCCVVECAHCKKTFYTRRAIERNPVVKYCSRECRNADIKRDRTRTCPACGKVFNPDRDSTKYCSHQCYLVNVNPRRQFFLERKRAAQKSGQSEGDT